MIHSHQSLYSGGVHAKKIFICKTFQAAYEDSVIVYLFIFIYYLLIADKYNTMYTIKIAILIVST